MGERDVRRKGGTGPAVEFPVLHDYLAWVQNGPLLSAAIQFAILGTAGEILASSLRSRRPALPCSAAQIAAKVIGWAVLGVVIKYGFAGMRGFTQALLDHHLLPDAFREGIGWAFAVSTFTNVLFGPQMMAFHRLEDNLILGRRGFDGIGRAWTTLIWFWIPAHTVTFMLPVDYQVGLAALWSVVLGVVLGLARPATSQSVATVGR